MKDLAEHLLFGESGTEAFKEDWDNAIEEAQIHLGYLEFENATLPEKIEEARERLQELCETHTGHVFEGEPVCTVCGLSERLYEASRMTDEDMAEIKNKERNL